MSVFFALSFVFLFPLFLQFNGSTVTRRSVLLAVIKVNKFFIYL